MTDTTVQVKRQRRPNAKWMRGNHEEWWEELLQLSQSSPQFSPDDKENIALLYENRSCSKEEMFRDPVLLEIFFLVTDQERIAKKLKQLPQPFKFDYKGTELHLMREEKQPAT